MSEPEADTKSRIFAAAEAEFLEKGYDRARMQAIADRAQINKAMLHYHFRSKDDLFAHVFREKAKNFFPTVDSLLRQGGSYIETVCRFVDAYLAHVQNNPYLPAFMLQVAKNHFELLEQVSIDVPRRFIAAFEAARARGEIRDLDPRQFKMSLMGMCVMPFVGHNLFRGFLHLDEASYQALLAERATEIKRYVRLLLTPGDEPATKEPSYV